MFRVYVLVPSLCYQDTPCSVGDGVLHSTAFAAGIQIAANWDRDLFYRRAVAIGKEFRRKGVHVALAPMVNPIPIMNKKPIVIILHSMVSVS